MDHHQETRASASGTSATSATEKLPQPSQGGWGFVLVDFEAPLRTAAVSDGAVVGSAVREARVKGAGVAGKHLRVEVRADGCYLEDLGSAEGTFVGGVRAQRIGVAQGDVVRLGRQLAVFVERELDAYAGPIEQSDGLVYGSKQRRDWVGPALDLARAGSNLCIEGGPGLGKKTLARLALSVRVDGRESFVVEPGAPVPPEGAEPTVWLVPDADRLPRAEQTQVAALATKTKVQVIATVNAPLDRAVREGLISPTFAALFTGKRVRVPGLEARREDLLPLLGVLCQRHGIADERLPVEFQEGILRAGWPGGVPELESALVEAAEAGAPGGPLALATVAGRLARAAMPATSPAAADATLRRAQLADALTRANGSVANAARALGLSRQALYREASRLGLDVARRK